MAAMTYLDVISGIYGDVVGLLWAWRNRRHHALRLDRRAINLGLLWTGAGDRGDLVQIDVVTSSINLPHLFADHPHHPPSAVHG